MYEARQFRKNPYRMPRTGSRQNTGACWRPGFQASPRSNMYTYTPILRFLHFYKAPYPPEKSGVALPCLASVLAFACCRNNDFDAVVSCSHITRRRFRLLSGTICPSGWTPFRVGTRYGAAPARELRQEAATQPPPHARAGSIRLKGRCPAFLAECRSSPCPSMRPSAAALSTHACMAPYTSFCIEAHLNNSVRRKRR